MWLFNNGISDFCSPPSVVTAQKINGTTSLSVPSWSRVEEDAYPSVPMVVAPLLLAPFELQLLCSFGQSASPLEFFPASKRGIQGKSEEAIGQGRNERRGK